jgi:hypothetical protein
MGVAGRSAAASRVGNCSCARVSPSLRPSLHRPTAWPICAAVTLRRQPPFLEVYRVGSTGVSRSQGVGRTGADADAADGARLARLSTAVDRRLLDRAATGQRRLITRAWSGPGRLVTRARCRRLRAPRRVWKRLRRPAERPFALRGVRRCDRQRPDLLRWSLGQRGDRMRHAQPVRTGLRRHQGEPLTLRSVRRRMQARRALHDEPLPMSGGDQGLRLRMSPVLRRRRLSDGSRLCRRSLRPRVRCSQRRLRRSLREPEYGPDELWPMRQQLRPDERLHGRRLRRSLSSSSSSD